MATTPNLQLKITANVSGQQQVQSLINALQQLRNTSSAAGGGSANPFASIASGASSAIGSVSELTSSVVGSAASMVAGFLAVKTAAEGFFAAFKKGIDMNAANESSQLGIRTLILSLYDVRDATGQLAQGPERIGMAAQEATKQILLLKQAGLETAATGKQLQDAFVQGLSAGAKMGLSIDQIRQLTIQIVQAAGTLGVPMYQLNQEVRSLLSGQIDHNSTVATALGLTNQQIKQWKEQGTLAEQLTAKMKDFSDAGKEAQSTWTATLSNIQDATGIVLGQMTQPAFNNLKKALNDAFNGAIDFDTLKVSSQFAQIEKLGESIFGGFGRLLSDGIYAAVDGAKQLNDWLAKNSDAVTSLELAFGYIVDAVVSIVKTMGSAVATLVQWGVESGTFQVAMNTVALTLAMIQDGFQLMKQYIAEAGAWVLDKLGKPIQQVLQGLSMTVAVIPGIGSSVAESITAISRNIPTNGDGLRAVASEVAAKFAAGNTAVNSMQQKLATGLKTAKDNAAEMDRLLSKQKDYTPTGGSITAKPQPPDTKAAAKAQKAAEDLAKAQAEAVKAVNAAARAADEADLDRSLEEQLISYKDYMAKKAALQVQELAEDRAALEKQRAQIAARQTTDAADAIKKQADLIKINGQIDALTQKERQVKIKLVIDTDQYVRDMRNLNAQVQADLLDSQGRAADASRVRIENQRKQALENPKLTDLAGGADAVNATFANKQIEADLAGQATLLQRRNDTYKRYDEALQQLQDAGQLTSLEHERLLQQNRAEVIADEEKLVAQMEADAAASDNPDLKSRAAQARLNLEALKLTADSVAKSINESFSQALVQGLGDLIKRAKSVGDVLRDILLSVVQTWEKIAAQNLAESIFGKIGGSQSSFGGLFSASSGGMNFGNIFSSLSHFFGGFFADGGIVSGPGTGTSDSIVARLSNGEGIVNAAAVQYWGEDFIHWLNATPGYATGGIAGGATSDKVSALAAKAAPASGAGAPAPQVNLRLVNSIDPELSRNAMDSVEGERVIENILSRNPNRFRVALGV
ncbi:prophage tail length tape measure protein [Burkholderia pseudomallei]|nr:prophage tail length tape measure protein [Burkholderia pseudomallei]